MTNLTSFFFMIICVSFYQTIASERGYMLIVPRVFTQDCDNELQFHLFELSGNGKITIQLVKNDNKTVVFAKQDYVIDTGTSKHFLNFKTPQIPDYEAEIVLSGAFPMENEEDYKVFGSDKVNFRSLVSMFTFIQTDKPLYKPGQTVQIRILMTDTALKPLGKNAQATMWIEDPKSSRLAQWQNLTIGSGLIQREFLLSNEPPLGIWTIYVSKDGTKESTTFEVKEYVLPKFEVTLTPPSYVLYTMEEIPVKICGRYTYGKNVEGTMKVNVSMEKYSWSNEKFPTIEYEGEIDGCYTYNVNVTALDESLQYTYRRITVVAEINETNTGVVRNASIFIDRTQTPLYLRFDSDSRQYFKAGVPFHTTLKITHPDDTIAPSELCEICATISRERNLNQWWATRKMKYCRNYTSNENGIVPITVPPQTTDVVSINLEAKSLRNFTTPRKSMPQVYTPQTSTYLRPWYSPSGTHMQVQRIREPLPCGKTASIQLLYTAKDEGIYEFYYEVINRGKVLQSGNVVSEFKEEDNISEDTCEDSVTSGAKVTQIVPPQSSVESEDDDDDDNNCKAIRESEYIPMRGSVNISIPITAATSPSFHLLVYNVKDDRETVADSQKFSVERCFDNKVDFIFGDEVKQPGEKTSYKLSSSPNSLCGIKVVDKSIKLLNNNDQLTPEKVYNALQKLDSGHNYPRGHCYDKKVQPGLERQLATASMVMPPRPWTSSSSYEDSMTAFENAGFLVISDFILLTRPCKNNQYEGYGGVALPSMGVRGAAYAPSATMVNKRGPSIHKTTTFAAADSMGVAPALEMTATKSVVDVRSFFPETWLFDLKYVGEEGEMIEKVTLPHSITEWMGSAVCINEETGLGLTAKDATVKGFQAFFLSFTLPYSVKRGEKLTVIVTAFNYLDECLPIALRFEQTEGFNLLSDKSAIQFCVCGGKSSSKKFVIEPKILGTLNLTASGASVEDSTVCVDESTATVVARDALTNQLLVEAEGFPYEKVTNALFCPADSKDGTFKQKFSYELPEDVVEDSGRGYISISGDIMGSTLQNLDNLVQLPTGCGEQNMITFSPIISVLDYLTSTNQLNDVLKTKAIGYLNSGYQRELKYRHSDGSFSAFGERDRSGSTFLTAFVMRSFAQAKKYIDIDSKIIDSSMNWLTSKQKPDGSFPEIGLTLSHGIKGGLNASSTAMAAYVLSALFLAGFKNQTIIDSALAHINTEEDTLDPYKAALFGYTFALAGDKPSALKYVSRAIAKAETEDGETKWKIQGSTASSVSLEISAYAILTLVKLNEPREETLAIVRGATKSRNSRGGFSSTQDTILLLEALSAFASGLTGKVNFEVAISGAVTDKVSFTEEDKLLVKKQKVSKIPSDVEVVATGTGCGLIQSTVLCNTKNPQKKEVFDLQVKTENVNCKTTNIQICTKYLPESSKSNMALVEIKMVSGMAADIDSLQRLLQDKDLKLKRYEVENNNVNFYFDEIPNEMKCLKFQANEVANVQDRKSATVKVYDYYATEKRQEAIYNIEPCSP